MEPALDDEDDLGTRAVRYAGPVLILLIVGFAVWWFARQQTGILREAPSISTILPVEQPPPPPPPQPVKPPEVKEMIQPIPQQTNTPPPPVPQNNAVTENAPAQEGTDAFNIGSGPGTGMKGSGLPGLAENAATYGLYARPRIMAAIKASDVLHNKLFAAVVRIWFDDQGNIVRVVVTRSTGSDAYDGEIRRVLTSLTGFAPPGPTILSQMPIQFTIDEQRS